MPQSPEDVWAGQAGKLATFVDGVWSIVEAKAGWLVWVEDEALLLAHDGSAFIEAGGGSLEDIASLDINAGVNETTRFAVAS